MSNKHERLADRFADIFIRLNSNERLNTKALADEYGVCDKTIRRDLNRMECYLPLVRDRGVVSLDNSRRFDLTHKEFGELIKLIGIHNLNPTEHLKALESCDVNAMLKADKKARDEYNNKINRAYYTSSKFFKNTAKAAASQGFRMGARQAIGLVLAEIWFELKEALPNLLRKCQINFSLEIFWGELKNTLNNIFERVKLRFKDVLNTFKDSFIAGVLSSITNTVLNIFLTSTKLMGKLIRESWNNLVQVIKLLVLNPQKLAFGDLMREITRLIFASVSTILGVMLHQHLATVLTMPFGTEIAAFISALFTGLLMVGTAYFIDYSPLMKKVWEFLNNLKNKYDVFLDHMKEINAELNAYVTNLAKIEFNLNPQELRDLFNALSHASNEIQKGQVLQAEIYRRGIELPYEMGNSASTMSWLQSKAKKLHG
ncbi:DeoR family transcriptional regulator [Moraxella bovis]|uniref:DeoR-like helix-turn-helix domain n=1 Tax=Moraxella bovis TaxID=476 RepID=A0A378PRE9_MORBO|nr:DeoR family transcriptional regulator [Moraxella bovis]STY91148.1 DeoR-like helix-turn-helix domain [Moraxella bovis]